ncbi:6-hydroxymethylpterin diphosphokinase MptE-like protein [Sulfurivirga caldicuralii]|nr:6-hydroxymethylpterin diphosphokinase MptE-like protein [Sulfurivirga caldicuralii]
MKALAEAYPEYIDHNRYMVVRSLAILDNVNPDYAAMWPELLETYKIFQFSQASLLGTRRFIDAQLFNVPFNEKPVADLKDVLQGRSVLLLGGGPTLDNGIEWIKQNRDQLIIAAVARIGRRLKEEGITPDFFAAVDPNDVSYDNSKWITPFEGETCLLHTNYTNSALLGEWRNLDAFSEYRYPWHTEAEVRNLPTVGPTVTNTLLQLVTYMGAENIYLLGVDFCFGPRGETHESGSLEAKMAKNAHESDLRIETYSGRQALTNTPFYQAAQAMESFVQEIRHERPNLHVYQLGHESARLKGVPLARFEKVQLNSRETIKKVRTAIAGHLQKDPPTRKRYLQEALGEVQTELKKIRSVQKLAKEGMEKASRLFEDYEQLDRLTQGIVRIKKKLESRHKDELELLFQYAVGSYKEFMRPQDEEQEQSHDEIKTSLTNYFEAFHKNATDLRHALERSIKHIQNEIDALDPAKLQKCTRFWIENGMEGRIYWWLKFHALSPAELNDKDRKLVEKLQSLHEDKLHNDLESKLVNRLQSQAQKLEHQLKLLNELFEARDKHGIEILLPALKDGGTQRAEQIHALGCGYLAELSGKEAEALQAYLQVNETDILPKALNRIAQIALRQGNLELAMPALEMLIQYDERYLILYADLLAAQGDFAGAVQLYDHYLSKHMDDYSVWLKAGEAAFKGGDMIAAQQCALHVLEKTADAGLRQQAEELLNRLDQE